jgi:ribosomal protein S18 acetylase RimI-like enzyme
MRELTEEDWPAFLIFKAELLKETNAFFPSIMREKIYRKSDDREVWCGWLKGKIIGIARISPLTGPSFIGYAILKEYRGQGFGNILMEFLFERLKSHEIKTARATVFTNNWKSILLLYKFGFRVIDEIKRVLIFEKQL